MSAEPYGHRGHPTFGEQAQSQFVRGRLGVAIVTLYDEGFDHAGAVSFITGIAWEVGMRDAERWSSPDQCRRTVINLLNDGAAKFWSLRHITVALDELKELL